MYDELEGLSRQFKKDIERTESMILRGLDDLVTYKMKCAELRVWRAALASVEDVRKASLKQEYAVHE